MADEDERTLEEVQAEITKHANDASCSERVRDQILLVTKNPILNIITVANVVLIVGNGAFFFWLLMGWQAMCDDPKKTDCEPRNWWYNCSIQVLNASFTYGALLTLPWRLSNFVHLFLQSKRATKDGVDHYGDATDKIWFYIPRYHRKAITLITLGNTFSQFVNQGTRLVFYSFALQNVSPGNIWTNVFFALAFSFAGIGAFYKNRQEMLVRQAFPGRFRDPMREVLQKLMAVLGKGEVKTPSGQTANTAVGKPVAPTVPA